MSFRIFTGSRRERPTTPFLLRAKNGGDWRGEDSFDDNDDRRDDASSTSLDCCGSLTI